LYLVCVLCLFIMPIHLSTPIEKLTRVGKVTSGRLKKLGILSVKNLLEHYPFRFDDYSQILRTDKLSEGSLGSLFGTITKIEAKKTARRHMMITEAHLDDGRGSIKIIWFNQPYITETLHEGDTIAIAGKVENDFTGWVIKNPNFEKARSLDSTVHTARLVPVYPATGGITQKQIRFLITQALEASEEFSDIIPHEAAEKADLISKTSALRNIHLPRSASDYLAALRRLKFEELFFIQLLTEQSKKSLKSAIAPKIAFNIKETKKLVESLPFSLTDDQRRAAWQILQDMERVTPMNRLLQGDVGSGKTAVAAIAALNASVGGWQTAFMAPTEILALQHYETIRAMFPNHSVAALTSKHQRISGPVIAREGTPDRGNPAPQSIDDGIAEPVPSISEGSLNTRTRNDIKKAIADGRIDIVIGTHAIIQDDVSFNNLGLIIIDEQHRFGVEQRKKLKDKSAFVRMGFKTHPNECVPHFLSMTATPIPRSLALTLYGDLDISTIRQMPAGRKPIQTRIVEENSRQKAYEFIKQKIAAKKQVFVICPLIEESDALGVKSATREYKKLHEKIFPHLSIGLLHGKLKSAEKEKIMNDFKENRISMLVSTAVVEVGVDVPNAAVMMIEGAERFGLSQLHQFRGRIGRGEHQSHCFLFTDSKNPETARRLQSFIRAKDGFEIAEIDLSMRGPGQIYGTTQSGYLTDLKLAKLTDSDLIAETREYARVLLEKDPKLKKHPELKFALEKRRAEFHFE